MTKSLTRTDNSVQIIFWMLVVQTALGILPALLVWRAPPNGVWGWILVVAFCATFSHYCMTRALRHAEATAVVPIDFIRVPLTALVGWLVYAERIDLLTVVGTLLILGRQSPQPRSLPAATCGRLKRRKASCRTCGGQCSDEDTRTTVVRAGWHGTMDSASVAPAASGSSTNRGHLRSDEG
jgi:uncharacterized membrane protein